MLWCLMFISLIGSHVADVEPKKLSGKTSQSTDLNDKHSSDKAVDGDTGFPCARTKALENSWWRIDLEGVYNISSVIVHAWGQCDKVQIYIGNSRENNGTNNTMVPALGCSPKPANTDVDKGIKYEGKPNLSGRYVTVFSRENITFSLCEVEINGRKKESPFLLIKEEMNWENALNYCREKHMDLASILNDEDQAWAELEARKASTPFVWLGLRYTCTLGFWFWVQDHCVEFNLWDLQNKTEGCETSCAMQTEEDHLWYTKPDNEEFNFLCTKCT